VACAQEADGLAAWDRVYAVASHPRCTNCHVGPQDAPMWEGLDYGDGARHGMNVRADDSRIGAESVPCRTCHVTSGRANDRPHAAPHIDEPWRLPPVELAWLGAGSAELCRQMRDPETNDGHDLQSMVDHIRSSAFIAWGFAPGGGREPVPGSVEALAADVLAWGRAGMPCR
jgi:hypothetical protein